MKCAACQKEVPSAKFCGECGAALSVKPRFGDYEVEAVIGEGGMGRVFKAIQPRLKRAVCVKTLLPQFARDEQVMARFEREATTTATLKHPNIVGIIDVGRADDGSPYIVMEYVEGRPLRQVLRDEAPLPAARAVALIDQVLAGLAEAHAHNIVHRDLKPSNVLVVALKDGSEHCKVLDFGIARTIGGDESDPHLTRTGMMLGTPGYMAPEQISSGDFDHRADLYAAGVILFELLTGQRLFRAPNETELLKKTLLEDPPKPSSRTANNVPAALDDVVLRAVSRDLKVRYASATDFREALSKALGSGSGIFNVPAPQAMVIDTTPLATATAEKGSSSTTNPRTLLAAVLSSSGWELSHMLEAFERSVNEIVAAEDAPMVGVVLRALQESAKQHAQQESFKAVVTLLRSTFLAHLETVLVWLGDPARAQVASWVLKVLGREATKPLLERLQGTPDERARAVKALRLVESKPADLVELVRSLAPTVLKSLVQQLGHWPDDDAFAFATAALSSPSAPHRQAGLEGLDEKLALRCATIIRARLHDPTPPVRAEALRWVFRLEDDGAVPALMQLIERPATPPQERRMMYRTLAHLGGSALTPLIRALSLETDPSNLSELVTLLTRRGGDAVEAVKEAAQNPRTPMPLKQLCLDGLKAAQLSRAQMTR